MYQFFYTAVDGFTYSQESSMGNETYCKLVRPAKP